MEPRHERIAKVALTAGAQYGLALAGGYAVQAHGMGTRPSGDVDLFTSWQHRDEFPELTAAVIAALESTGYTTSVVMQADTFVRLMVTDPSDGTAEKVELSADWRAHDPVQLDIGPVLHADDAIANKVCALFGRALPRDFLDVDAAITSGRYTRDQLLELAAAADYGFDPLLFADALGALTQITDAAFAEYRTAASAITEMRRVSLTGGSSCWVRSLSPASVVSGTVLVSVCGASPGAGKSTLCAEPSTVSSGMANCADRGCLRVVPPELLVWLLSAFKDSCFH